MHGTSAAPDGAGAEGGRARFLRRERPALVRGGVAVVGGVLAVAAVLLYQDYARQQGELRRLIAAVELDRRQPEAVDRILWDPDVEMGRLQVARALLYEALDPQAFAALPLAERMKALALVPNRLQLARQIAAEILQRRPAAWAAAMIIGASYYVEWSLRGDPRLVSERRTWERPLEVASEMAPGEEEPRRFLALAYLEIWPVLPESARARLFPLLREALTDRPTFERASGVWLEMVASAQEAEALIPDATWAWQAMMKHSARRQDWRGYERARERLTAAQEKELTAAMAELEARRLGGDTRRARQMALGLIADAAPDRRSVALVERALQLLPPGPVAGDSSRALMAWLEWGFQMALWEQPGLSPTALRRLAALLEPLPPPEAALAALLVGDLVTAEALERRQEAVNTEPWAPYCILKARVLAARGEAAAARRLLGQVQMLWVGSIPELRSRFTVALAEGDVAAAAASERALAQLTGEQWPATSWRWRGRVATSGFLAARPAPGLALSFDLAPPGGAALQISLDGRSVPVGYAVPGSEVVIQEALEAGIHVLAVASSSGGRVVPGRFRLLPL